MQTSPQPLVVTPTVKRRLISMVYEVFLLAAVEMFAVLVYLLLTGNRTVYRPGLMAYLFVVTAAYFVHFWTDSGHTLAMKTWRIKLVKVGYKKVPYTTAVLRYLLAWGWVAPALAVIAARDIHRWGEVAAVFAVGFVAWALTPFLSKDRQFLHDRLAGTRLISLPKPVKAAKPAKK